LVKTYHHSYSDSIKQWQITFFNVILNNYIKGFGDSIASLLSIIAQNESAFWGGNWYFKDSVQLKFGHPNIWYIGILPV